MSAMDFFYLYIPFELPRLGQLVRNIHYFLALDQNLYFHLVKRGCGHKFGLYAINPKSILYLIGLLASKDSFILLLLYHSIYLLSTYINSSRLTLRHQLQVSTQSILPIWQEFKTIQY